MALLPRLIFGPDTSHLKPTEVVSVLHLERCLESADRTGANRDAESAGFHREMHVTIVKAYMIRVARALRAFSGTRADRLKA
jgi:hypothetical protein